MGIIHTERNVVYAYDVEPDDVFVEVGWFAPVDDDHVEPIYLPYEPISNYDASVEWAKGIADEMAFPIHVLPLNHSDMLNTNRWEPYAKLLAGLNDQERAEMRQVAITTCASIMRDCKEHSVRKQAYDILVQLKVVNP